MFDDVTLDSETTIWLASEPFGDHSGANRAKSAFLADMLGRLNALGAEVTEISYDRDVQLAVSLTFRQMFQGGFEDHATYALKHMLMGPIHARKMENAPFVLHAESLRTQFLEEARQLRTRSVARTPARAQGALAR